MAMPQTVLYGRSADLGTGVRSTHAAIPSRAPHTGAETGRSVFRSTEAAARRLHLLARVKWPSTRALLCRAGIHRGMHCLDVGCASGEVTMQMARMVAPEGNAVGIDTDEGILARARAEAVRERLRVQFQPLNAAALEEDSAYDLVYARFLLAHLQEPEHVLVRMVRATRPGGVIVVEDVDLPGHLCHPPCAAFDRYVELYQELVQRQGGDAVIGPRLPDLLRNAGVEEIHLEVVQPTFCDGDGKLAPQVTMEHIRGEVVEAGLASHAEVDAIIAELDAFATDWHTVVSMARVFQVWGRRLTLPAGLPNRRQVDAR